MTTATHYVIPEEPGRWEAFAMAAVVHLALLALLWVGIRWQSQTPVTLEAEIWSPQVQEAAPLPEPVQAIKPEPIPASTEKAKPVVEQPAVTKPDIVLEQKKARKAEEKKRLEELAKKEEEQRVAADKAAELAKKNKAAAKAAKDAADKKRLEEEAEEKLATKLREEQMQRIRSSVSADSTGNAATSQGSRADPSYVNILKAKIKSNTIFAVPPDLRGNPAVEYTVELFPDGSVKSIKKERSSQLPGFDEAVERGIRSAAPYPRDKFGIVPPVLNFPFTPKEK